MTHLMAGCRLLEFGIRHDHFIQRDALFTWLEQMWRSVATQAGDERGHAGYESALAALGESGRDTYKGGLSLAVFFVPQILIDLNCFGVL